MDTPFRGRNRWPDEELLPGFRPAMTEYYHAMNGVADRCCLRQGRELRHLSQTACCYGTQCCSMRTTSWEA